MSDNKRENNLQNPKQTLVFERSQLQFSNMKKEDNYIDLQLIYGIIKAEKLADINQYITIDKISRNKTRSLIGRWFPPSSQHLSIKDVVDDIYFRVSNRIEGRKDYYTGRPTKKQKKGRYVYILIIRVNIILFIDENRGICYIII